MAITIKKKKRKPLTAQEITARKRAMVNQYIEYQSERMGGALTKSKKNRIKRKKHMGMQSNLRKKKKPMPIMDNR